jgi:hypothetical protein
MALEGRVSLTVMAVLQVDAFRLASATVSTTV